MAMQASCPITYWKCQYVSDSHASSSLFFENSFISYYQTVRLKMVWESATPILTPKHPLHLQSFKENVGHCMMKMRFGVPGSMCTPSISPIADGAG